MDPEATLNITDQAISDCEPETAADALTAYYQWRNRGGFEPYMRAAANWGDKFARYCANRLENLTLHA